MTMSRKSRAAYYSQIEHVYSHCVCGAIGARYSKKDGKTLCKTCRPSRSEQLMAEYLRQGPGNVMANDYYQQRTEFKADRLGLIDMNTCNYSPTEAGYLWLLNYYGMEVRP